MKRYRNTAHTHAHTHPHTPTHTHTLIHPIHRPVLTPLPLCAASGITGFRKRGCRGMARLEDACQLVARAARSRCWSAVRQFSPTNYVPAWPLVSKKRRMALGSGEGSGEGIWGGVWRGCLVRGLVRGSGEASGEGVW